eukprot:6461886-Amphidinium_carterae.4
MSLSAPEVVRRVQELCRASSALSQHDVLDLYRLVFAFSQATEHCFHAWVEAHASAPVLVQYSSDCTPSKHRESQGWTTVDGQKVRQRVEASSEFILQHILCTALESDGSSSTTCVAGEPLIIAGKSMAYLTAVGVQFSPLRGILSVTDNICVFCQTYDRGIGVQLLHGLSGHYYRQRSSTCASSDAGLADLLQWHVHCYCAPHDGHNALKWAQSSGFLSDKSVIKDLWAGISGYRYIRHHCLSHLRAWLLEHVVERSEDVLPSTAVLEFVWGLVGVSPTLIEPLAHDMRLHWSSGKLCVRRSFLAKPDWLEILSGVWLSICNIKAFSSSRWLSVGQSFRSMVASALCGFTDLADQLRAKNKVSKYFSAGCSKVTCSCWQYLVRTGRAAIVLENFILSALEDARIPKNLAIFKENMLEDYKFVAEGPPEAFQLISDSVHLLGQDLRSQVLSSLLVSMSYIHHTTLVLAGLYPWALCEGDIEENMRALEGLDAPPPENVTARIYVLLRNGFPRHQIKDAIKLLGEIVWSTALTEKQHSGVSVIRRYHPDLGLSVLSGRGFLHFNRQLLPKASDEEVQFGKWEKQFRKLQSKAPRRLQGRNLFVQHIFRKSTKLADRADATQPRRLSKRWIMAKHITHWNLLKPAQRAAYNRRADLAKIARIANTQNAIEEHVTQGLLLKERMADSLDLTRVPNKLQNCALKPPDIDHLALAFNNTNKTRRKWESERDKSLRVEEPLSAETMSGLVGSSLLTEVLPDLGPKWLSSLCRHRTQLETAILSCTIHGRSCYWRFLYASLRPVAVSLLPLGKVASSEFNVSEFGVRRSQQHVFNQSHFKYEVGSFETGSVWKDVDWECMQVQLESFFGVNGILITYDTPMFLPELVLEWDRDLEGLAADTSHEHAAAIASKVPNWLQSFVQAEGSEDLVPDLDDADEAELAEDDGDVDEVEVGFKVMCTALAGKKETWKSKVSISDWFHEALCEDKRLLAKKGDTIHATLITVKKETPMYDFVHKMGLPKSGRFETSVYTEEGAGALTRLFTSRLVFLYELYTEHGSASKAFVPGHLSKWKEPLELAELRAKWPKRAIGRCDRLCSMVPSLS